MSHERSQLGELDQRLPETSTTLSLKTDFQLHHEILDKAGKTIAMALPMHELSSIAKGECSFEPQFPFSILLSLSLLLFLLLLDF